MATNPAGLNGAMFDPDTTNGLGALNCGLGGGINSVYGPPVIVGVPGDGVPIARLGGTPPYGARAQACGYPGKVVTLQLATVAAIAPAGAMPGGGVNRTGQTVPIGGACYAVAP